MNEQTKEWSKSEEKTVYHVYYESLVRSKYILKIKTNNHMCCNIGLGLHHIDRLSQLRVNLK